MPQFPATIPLSGLSAADGFKIIGEAAYDNAGRVVSSAGDVNGDGFADVIVGARGNDAGGNYAGAAYVVFGKASGFGTVDLDAVALGTGGFKIIGQFDQDRAGYSVSAAGDVNGDGLADVIVGASGNDATGDLAGAAYVVFGKASGAEVNLDDVAQGTGGFRIVGEAAGDGAGFSVSSLGDVNGDGLADVIVGAFRNDAGGINAGAAYVVFGKASGVEVDLAALGAGGVRITGDNNDNYAGISLSSAGDFNGDGFVDLIIGARDYNNYAGAAYVVFGKVSGFDPVDLSDVALGTGGFKIFGENPSDRAGYSVSSAGDFNGDGLDDLIVGAQTNDGGGGNAGAAYVIFGKTSGFDPVNLDDVALGTGGFKITGEGSYNNAGISVSSAGDVNGDGFADLIIGSRNNGNGSYVVFGKAAGFGPVNLDDVALGTGGFKIVTENPNEASGRSVSAAGDVNGDGFADVIVGAYTNSTGGGGAGAAYVVFGREATENLNLTGTAIGNRILGGTGNDTINGLDGDDRLFGRGGGDTLVGGEGKDRLDGGAGVDTMDGGNGNDTYYVDHAGDTIIDSSGTDRLFASVDYTLANNVAIERMYAVGTDGLTLTGNRLANLIVGADGDDTLIGGIGDDTLSGGAGGDTLVGGAGLDSLTGGVGEDIFVFDARLLSSNIDTITDFTVGEDTIQLDNAIFTKLRFDGPLAAKFFAIGSAQDATDRVLYDSATGALSYDADGNGAEAAVQFAQLGTGLALTAADFLIV